jgi:hypothetical protein
MNAGIIAFACLAALTGSGLAQTVLPVDPTKSVRISGRLILPGGGRLINPIYIYMAEVGPDGLNDGTSTSPDSRGLFTFFGRPGTKYRVYLGGGYNGIKTPPRIVETADGKDVDVGEIVVENCSPWIPQGATLRAPTSTELIGDLRLEQITIEPQQPLPPERLEGWPGLTLPSRGFLLPLLAPQDTEPLKIVDLPQCWTGPSLDRRSEWEALSSVWFDQAISIESFVGGKVKSIRVVRYDPQLTPSQIREEVRKVWLSVFMKNADTTIGCSEGNAWNIEADIDYEDGKHSSILMDAGHVQVQDHEGKYWFIP